MARLPKPGQDSGKWGDILNEFLTTIHNDDGSLKQNTVTADALAPQAVTVENIVATGGQDGQVLVKDATVSGGMAWRTPSGGTVAPATTTTLGTIQLSGALGGTATSPTVPELANKVNTAQLGVANGVATLGADGKVPVSQLPAPTGGGGGAVDSVAGRTGAVVLAKADVGLDNVDNTSDAAKPVSTPVQTALDAKADASAVYTKTESDAKYELKGTAGATTLDGLTDVTASGATNGQSLVFNGTEWGPATVGTGSASIPDATSSTKGVITLAGDLAGDANTPQVAKINGVVVTGTPAAGNVLTASGATAASWAAPATGGSGGTLNVTPKSAAYTAADKDFILANCASGPFTVTLPTLPSGSTVSVKKIDGSLNAVKVQANIDNMTYYDISTQWESRDFLSDGAQWYNI